MRSSPTLRMYLFCSLLALSWLPIVLLATWTYQSVVDRARSEVHERHLLVSHHLTLALDRYTRDAESAFQLAVTSVMQGSSTTLSGTPLSGFLSDLGFRHVCVVDSQRRIQRAYCALNCPASDVLPQRTFDQIAGALTAIDAAPGEVAWSGVIEKQDGTPVVILALRRPDGLIALGELTMDYVRSLQGAVRFGEKGHAAIVDQNGRVLAHPRAAWVDERKDISKVSAVQAMMRGESGVTEFFSPALQADMIAGFSTVSRTGWGVMVPQPVHELYLQARNVAWVAAILAFAMMCITGIVSWFLARHLSNAFEPLRAVALRVDEGDLSARVGNTIAPGAPREFHAVGHAVDGMMDRLAEANHNEVAAQINAQRAEDLHRAKAALLAHVSHELRTPLNAIIGFSDVIRAQLLGPIGQARYLEYANDIWASGRSLLGLIDRVLEVSRSDLSSDAHDDDEEWLDVSELASRALDIVGAASTGRRRRVFDTEPNLPLVRLHRARFMQVLINLIDNAEKFTDDNGLVRVAVTVDAHNRLMVAIEDDGIGMTDEDIATCTSAFGRSRDPLVRQRNGVGLGLSLVASIVDRLGAALAIDSRPGRGTRVSVILPEERSLRPNLRELAPAAAS
ncbi:sensor histidine kinase [Thalassobaculum sp.]|uniref:HAMP domain-containing sensor histidine kinase n=1 Tax=Thalassobaculum sp. TaxID=2022740 RepID=UPI0032EC5527